MGSKGGSAPAPPDYSSVAQSNIDAAKVAQQTSREQLDWAKQQYADQAPITKQYIQSMITASDDNQAAAKQAQQRLEGTYYPVEDQFVRTAQDYNTPARASERSAAAQADVASAFEGQRKAALSSLESYGIDPSQTRYGALDLGTRISQAAATAAAGTTSRQQSEAQGLALQGEAINIGRGYPGQVAQAYNTATSTGSSGIGAGLNTTSTYSNAMGTPATWAGIQAQNLAGATSTMNTGFQNQFANYQAGVQSAGNTMSGIGSMVGTVGAVAGIAIAV